MVPDKLDPLVAEELKRLGLKSGYYHSGRQNTVPPGFGTKTVNGNAG